MTITTKQSGYSPKKLITKQINFFEINLYPSQEGHKMKKNPALTSMKQEVASELGVPLKEGYNGDITAKQAGSVGGEMVKRMIQAQEQQMGGTK